jgi:hypothetical protein
MSSSDHELPAIGRIGTFLGPRFSKFSSGSSLMDP